MTGTSLTSKKFDGTNDFALWQVRMKALLEQQGLASGGGDHQGDDCSGDLEKVRDFIHDKLVGDLAAIDTAISDEDQAFL
ncbi:hypothetical protein Tco_0790374 [Tanacetum coccineum]